MNQLKNDRGQWVVAIGAPGSQAHVRCEYPRLIEELQTMRLAGKTSQSALGRIRKEGVRGMLDYESLLLEAGYTPVEAASQARCYGSWQR